MGVGSLHTRYNATVVLSAHHKVLVFQGDGVQDVSVKNNGASTVTIYIGSKNSSTTDTITSGSTTTFTTPYQLWVGTGAGNLTVLGGSGLTVDDLRVTNDITLTDDIDADAITATSISVDGAAGIIASADGGKDTLALSNTTANVGLTIGADTNLYRSAANTLYTDDALSVAGAFAAVGAATVGTTLGVTGVTTTTGGVAGGQNVFHSTFDNNTATSGTDTSCDNGGIWAASVFIPANCTLTGIQYLVGSTGGTDSVVVGLYNNAGTLVANSALAGATVGTAAQVQQVAFTATYAAVGPARYFVAVQFNGTTAKLRTIPAYCGLRTTRIKQAGVFGTLAALSPVPTANVADVGAIASTY